MFSCVDALNLQRSKDLAGLTLYHCGTGEIIWEILAVEFSQPGKLPHPHLYGAKTIGIKDKN
ncbi:hypothetical protein NIES932_09370 [Raphidiopsis curvata NIES-932]|nr:hypothetical protein NIES932_09370 [Raphidiopsis curvata NIES-932]